ncbi:MAG: preprotein translocase subunit SecA [Bacilli bacterium]|nr:preprotein translocase subunit SecA [Bacilli bacterium]
MANFIEKLFRLEERELNKYAREADRVLAYDEAMTALSDDELKHKTVEFRERLANGETLDDIKYEAFAVAREAGWRVLHQKPFKVQIIGSLVLHGGNVAEMRTGEGKTLTATMAVYLNALEGKGVHVITVNEYLASRDAEWMGQIYRWLGLTTGVNLASKSTMEKREAYKCDITYTTNSELGFDYLRDNMAPNLEGRVLRGLNFAVVDEADSVLVDESRTPLIISGGARSAASQYQVADRFCKMLKKDVDFTIDIKDKACSLTESGNDKAERLFGVTNLYNPENNDLVHRIHQALKANYIMARDVEYMVDKDHTIQLIDQFTGRVMPGREYNDGLQQAIQAKEGVEIKQETVVMATITYQNFFRLYTKLAGMTGTAKTEEEEFITIFNMKVIVIPTNKPIQRIDDLDLIFATHDAKLKALVQATKERHEKGQPVLIGTVSVESNEEISALLTAAGVPHEVLNAKNQAREAEIISHAGELGAVTLATNMAGRGTDIKITPEVEAVGGLCVFGTERHESRRIDNQLRGRSGRQGNVGYSRFFVSFDDDLMRRFAPENIRKLFTEQLQEESYENKMLMNAVTNAQKQIEGRNFDTRKNLKDYDDVLAKQRDIIYKKRDSILYAEDIVDLVHDFFKTCGMYIAERSIDTSTAEELISGDLLKKNVEPAFMAPGTINSQAFDGASVEEAGEDLGEALYELYIEKRKGWSSQEADQVERYVALKVIDQNWQVHIDTMSHLRDGISLRSYAQTNPLQDYVNEGYDQFKQMNDKVAHDTCLNLLNVRIQRKAPEPAPAPVEAPKAPEHAPIDHSNVLADDPNEVIKAHAAEIRAALKEAEPKEEHCCHDCEGEKCECEGGECSCEKHNPDEAK